MLTACAIDSGMAGRSAWIAVMLALVGLQVVACRPVTAGTATKNEPARLESIDGSDLKRVVLTAKAAERIGLQTTSIREERIRRTRTVGAEVVLVRRVLVRVRLSPSELASVDRSQLALVLPGTAPDPATKGLTARLVASPAGSDASALHYAFDAADHGLAPGQRVLVTLPLLGGEMLRKIVPYSAVVYDLSGQTWIYTQLAPLTFVRHRITVEYVDGDLAILSEGPPMGTAVVTVGVTELFGTEFKVGK